MEIRLMGAAFALALALAPAGAKTVYVNKAAQGNVHDGASWATAFVSITDAVSAPSTATGDEIWVASATYNERVDFDKAVALYGGFAGFETERSQRDFGSNRTLIDSPTINLSTLRVQAAGSVVDGFTVRFGHIGIEARAGVTLSNNIVTKNRFGVYVFKSGAEATLDRNVITDNTLGLLINESQVRMTDTTISHSIENGIQIIYSDVTMTRGAVTNNGRSGVYFSSGSARFEGTSLHFNTFRGIEMYSGSLTLLGADSSFNKMDGVKVTGGTVSLRDSRFTYNGGEGCLLAGGSTIADGNTMQANLGQGIRVDKGSATLTRNAILGNGYNGLFVVSGTVEVSRGTISGNKLQGVGVYGGYASIRNNLITGNVDDGIYAPGGEAYIANNTIVANNSEGVVLEGKAGLVNNIIASNLGTGFVKAGAAVVTLFTHNNVWGNTPGDYAYFSPDAALGVISQDPLFANPTGADWRLRDGSPCTDAGYSPAVTPGETDRDGRARVVGQAVDMGAYEHAGPLNFADAARALRIGVGMAAMDPADASRLNRHLPAASGIDIRDAAHVARLAASDPIGTL